MRVFRGLARDLTFAAFTIVCIYVCLCAFVCVFMGRWMEFFISVTLPPPEIRVIRLGERRCERNIVRFFPREIKRK